MSCCVLKDLHITRHELQRTNTLPKHLLNCVQMPCLNCILHTFVTVSNPECQNGSGFLSQLQRKACLKFLLGGVKPQLPVQHPRKDSIHLKVVEALRNFKEICHLTRLVGQTSGLWICLSCFLSFFSEH